MECAYDSNICKGIFSGAFGAQKRLIVNHVVQNMGITLPLSHYYAFCRKWMVHCTIRRRHLPEKWRAISAYQHNKQSAFYISVSWKLYRPFRTGENLFSDTVRFRIFHGNSDLMRYPLNTKHWITRSEGFNWGSGTSNVS